MTPKLTLAQKVGRNLKTHIKKSKYKTQEEFEQAVQGGI